MEEAKTRTRTGGIGSARKGWLGMGRGWEFPWGDLVFQVVPSVSGEPGPPKLVMQIFMLAYF